MILRILLLVLASFVARADFIFVDATTGTEAAYTPTGENFSFVTGTFGTANAVVAPNADGDLVGYGALTWAVTAATCTGDASGGALTVNASNQIICSADDAGTGGHDPVTLAGSYDYLSLAGQILTVLQIDLATDVTGTLPAANGGTGQTSLGAVDAADLGSGAAADSYVLTADGAGNAAWEVAPGAGNGMTSWTLAGDTGGGQAITDGNTASIVGDASGIDTADSATDTLTISFDPSEAEAGLEAVLDLQDLQGAVTDAQVPDDLSGYVLDPGVVVDNQVVRWSGTSGAAVDQAGFSIADPASNVVLMQLDDTSDAIHLNVEPGADSAGLVVGRWTGSIPIGSGLGRYALFAEGPPAGPTYSHAIGAKSGGTDQEIIHLYNSAGEHVLRFNTEANNELEIIGSTAAGATQWYQVLGADPYMVIGGAAANRVGSTDLTVVGTVEATAGLTVGAVPVVTSDFFGTLTNANLCVYDLAGSEIDCNLTNTLHAAVTMAGEDYLSLSTQQITANAIDPDNLASADFGEFACNGTTCELDYALTWTRERTVSDPTDADDYLWFKAESTLTLTAVNCVAQGTTPSITVDVQECDSAGANCVTSLSSVITCNGGNDAGTISDSAVDSGDWVKLNLGSPSGTVDAITVQINGTKAL